MEIQFKKAIYQMDCLFSCHVKGGTIGNGRIPDKGQIGTECLPIENLLDYKFYPQSLRPQIINYHRSGKAKPM